MPGKGRGSKVPEAANKNPVKTTGVVVSGAGGAGKAYQTSNSAPATSPPAGGTAEPGFVEMVMSDPLLLVIVAGLAIIVLGIFVDG